MRGPTSAPDEGLSRSRLGSRARALAVTERARLAHATTRSADLFRRAVRTLPLGVASSFQACNPYPIYLSHGRGAEVFDVDGNTYADFHGAFGCGVSGHAHPALVEAIARSASRGTQLGAPTVETVLLAELLCERFGLERVRFCNSGTEATMAAIRLARAFTGRDRVAKVEGAYHGHHDAVMFAYLPDALDEQELAGCGEGPLAPMSAGIPGWMGRYTHAVPFNDIEALDRLLAARGRELACLILEPILMNSGWAEPSPGYLEAVAERCRAHGVILIFDEVKTGSTVAHGGAAELFGVRPDLSCLAKATFGGTPGAAVGGRADILATIERGTAQQGTYNGNPLVAAAALAALTEVLTPAAYRRLEALGTRLAEGCQRSADRHGIAAHSVHRGAKGCVLWRAEPVRDYADFLDTETTAAGAVHPWMLNRGLFVSPGCEEQWTLSVQHDEGHVDRYVEAFEGLCAALAR